MNRTIPLRILSRCLATMAFVLTCCAIWVPAAERATTNAAPKSPEETEAAYSQALEKRAADILAALDLKDSAKAAKVHDLLIAHYRALRAWHDEYDAKRKQAAEEQARAISASLKTLHDKFITSLSAVLTSDQVVIVKDRMTYGKVKVTYDAYCEIVPNLTDDEKRQVLTMLKEAREEAMDAGSADEKSAVFKKYKGRINNYLSKQGHDLQKAYKDWGERQKAKTDPSAAEEK